MKIQEQLKPALISHWMNKAFKAFYPSLSYYGTSDAPNNWKALQAFKGCLTGGESLPVFNGACDLTIYEQPRDNVTFRAWHDAIHLSLGLSFKPVDEVKVGLEHCRQLRLIGAPVHVINAVFFDVVGQVEYYSRHGQFVQDQKQFVQDCLILGVDNAINLAYDTATIQA